MLPRLPQRFNRGIKPAVPLQRICRRPYRGRSAGESRLRFETYAKGITSGLQRSKMWADYYSRVNCTSLMAWLLLSIASPAPIFYRLGTTGA
jgi:hypothetical protein